MNHAIVITGFMGTGKSTVGELVAQKLKRAFIDLDALIESKAGRTIPELFEEGEATFRWWEQVVLGQVDLKEPIVLATGGGTLIGACNQKLVGHVPVIVLDAPLAEIEARISQEGGRPLASQLAKLYQRRAAAYGRLPIRIPTAGRTPEEIAEEIMTLATQTSISPPAPNEGETLTVRTPDGASYEIKVQSGISAQIGHLLKPFEPSAVALITDSTIGPLWGETVRQDLLAAKLRTTLIEIPSGEAYKNLDTVSHVYDQLLDAGVDRNGAIVALGGGVVGDLSGFVAATWMRGVRTWVQVPTSILAMVDASVGGKTGVDHPRGKNLIGAFRQPSLVIVDPIFLQTLPPREARSGMAEVIKHGILADRSLFEQTGGADSQTTPSLLARAIRVKVNVVQKDPFERLGERAKLNLGHTFGHAYELMSQFALAHGEAVSIGIVTAARLSEVLGLAEKGLAAQIEHTLQRVGLPTRWAGGADGEAVWQTMQSDKKRAAKGLRFVLPRAIGDVIVTKAGELDKQTVIRVIEAQNGGEC
ncbi:MAG: 3-dehydroquinate synthase [Ardenticatenaceae bacterium]